MFRSPEWSLPFSPSNRNFVHISHQLMRGTCPADLVLLDVIVEDLDLQSMELLTMNFYHLPITSSLLGPDILLCISYQAPFNLCSSFTHSWLPHVHTKQWVDEVKIFWTPWQAAVIPEFNLLVISSWMQFYSEIIFQITKHYEVSFDVITKSAK